MIYIFKHTAKRLHTNSTNYDLDSIFCANPLLFAVFFSLFFYNRQLFIFIPETTNIGLNVLREFLIKYNI